MGQPTGGATGGSGKGAAQPSVQPDRFQQQMRGPAQYNPSAQPMNFTGGQFGGAALGGPGGSLQTMPNAKGQQPPQMGMQPMPGQGNGKGMAQPGMPQGMGTHSGVMGMLDKSGLQKGGGQGEGVPMTGNAMQQMPDGSFQSVPFGGSGGMSMHMPNGKPAATPSILGNRLSMFSPQGGAISMGYGGQLPNAQNPGGTMGSPGNPNQFAQPNWMGGSQMYAPPPSNPMSPPPAAMPPATGGLQPQAPMNDPRVNPQANHAQNFQQLMQQDPRKAMLYAQYGGARDWFQKNQGDLRSQYAQLPQLMNQYQAGNRFAKDDNEEREMMRLAGLPV